MMRTAFVTSAAVFALAIAAVAQNVGVKPSFEVATVKLNTAVQGGSRLTDQPGGRFIATRVTLRTLIGASGLAEDAQLVGGPGWIDSDLWDVEAKAPEGTVLTRTGPGLPDAMKLMLQSLVEDHFRLKAHREIRELPIYELSVVKGGARLKLSDDQTPPTFPPPAGPPPQRGASVPRGTMRMGNGNFEASALPFDAFVKALAALYLHRPATDKTGFKGLYDIRLQWTPDPALGLPIRPGGPVAPAPPTADPLGPDIFTAIQEQLGLKLESSKGPVPVLVIDSAQKP